MKKILCLFSALTLVLTSCSSEDSNSAENSVLPKTVSYTYSDYPEDNDMATVVYNGNKIVSAGYTANDKEVYTYTGDFITKIEDFAQEGNISSTNEFTYENGKLKVDLLTESSSDKTYISKNVYTYKADGTITFVSYSVDPKTKVETKKSEGVLTYSNGNLAKKTEIYGDNSETITYEYDTKNNPFKNILGYNLLIDFDSTASANNVTKSTNVYTSGGIATTSVYTSVYEYNEKDYPVKQTRSDYAKKQEITEYTY
jgi:hypothetical protein